jgi:hypothetical protein
MNSVSCRVKVAEVWVQGPSPLLRAIELVDPFASGQRRGSALSPSFADRDVGAEGEGIGGNNVAPTPDIVELFARALLATTGPRIAARAVMLALRGGGGVRGFRWCG